MNDAAPSFCLLRPIESAIVCLILKKIRKKINPDIEFSKKNLNGGAYIWNFAKFFNRFQEFNFIVCFVHLKFQPIAYIWIAPIWITIRTLHQMKYTRVQLCVRSARWSKGRAAEFFNVVREQLFVVWLRKQRTISHADTRQHLFVQVVVVLELSCGGRRKRVGVCVVGGGRARSYVDDLRLV